MRKRGGTKKGFSRREGLGRAGVGDVLRGSHEVMPCGVEKSTFLHHPGNTSSTGQVTCVKTSQKHDAIGGFNKHHAVHTEEWSKRDYPENGQGHSHGNFGQRQ